MRCIQVHNRAPVAHRIERMPAEHEAAGSIPARRTTNFRRLRVYIERGRPKMRWAVECPCPTAVGRTGRLRPPTTSGVDQLVRNVAEVSTESQGISSAAAPAVDRHLAGLAWHDSYPPHANPRALVADDDLGCPQIPESSRFIEGHATDISRGRAISQVWTPLLNGVYVHPSRDRVG
jgi:hypothetical protein